MALGRVIAPSLPDLREAQRIGKAERGRRPAPAVDLRGFWHDYLLGRDRRLGIELMTSTTAYAQLMGVQVERLALRDGDTVVDLGSGVGDFPLAVARREGGGGDLHVIEVDLVTPALARARERFAARPASAAQRGSGGLGVSYVAADLDRAGATSLPLAAGSADAVIASLLISYLSRPGYILREIYQLLAPGGRCVLSTLKRDADISRIYVEGIAELPPDRVREHFGRAASREFGTLQRRFLNDAVRLLDLEEQGLFRFWDADELVELVEKAGFAEVEAIAAFGDPPQAVVVSALRP
jgi:SAM-dependent methyltransferase